MTRGIDHIVLCVAELEAARRFYEGLGFTTTPPARHPFGTANSLVQLQGNFIELLGVAEPDRIPPHAPGHFSFGAFNRDYLTRRQGFSMLVFQSDDARADQAEFAAKGLDTYEPFDFSRKAALPDGQEVTVGFSLAFVTHPAMPEAAFFTCQQHAPEHFWKPDYQAHANGAVAISEVVMAVDEPADVADFFTKLQPEASLAVEAGQMTVTTSRGRIAVLAPARLAQRFPGLATAAAPETPHFAGYRVTVADLDRTEDLLRKQQVDFQIGEGVLNVAPGDAFGVALEFAAAPAETGPSGGVARYEERLF